METMMRNALKPKSSKTGRLGLRFAAIAMGIALSLAGGTTATAGGVPVYDGVNWYEKLWDRLQSAAEFGENVTRWGTLLQGVTDAIIKAQGIFKSFGLPPGAMLTPVPDNYMVAESCGSAGDLSIDTLFSYFVFNPAGDVKSQQRQICVNIRMMQNRKYNDSVQFIQQTIPKMDELMKLINAARTASSLRGAVDAVNSDSMRTANELAVQSQSWEARMKAYDAYIEVMEANQKVVAQAALKGDPTAVRLASDLVKTASLKAALSIK
ncbi:hypothetical protein D7T48_01090 [Stenotrophomonas maltophilia]|uniref:Uncharacterized protein n=2 Tax=Lysobacteraceae TaxID=32033 RepID=A0ABD7BZ20_STEMA|nr:hypothetical protein C6Y55_13795 [Stenotrophomonas maltophilia]ELC7322158.1 hypothetical protein [Stenotrophomonas maltophilia]MBA0276001.1 hypothetical protein [Stenotrophomonas maltophilia]MBA0411201.1 hypothetical protein [Stenotrophomonas maltophilia]MBA0496302.1 hypothetical protein [Stenotrophomonas maltophilia]